MSYKKLLTKSADYLLEMGYTQLQSVDDRIDEGKGITYTVFETRNGEVLYVRAKKYVYEGLAPFGVEHVRHARQKDAWLAIYFDDRKKFYVFDPRHVTMEGERQMGRSKRSDQRDWLEVPLDDGVPLPAFERGERPGDEDDPEESEGIGYEPPERDVGNNRTLDDFG